MIYSRHSKWRLLADIKYKDEGGELSPPSSPLYSIIFYQLLTRCSNLEVLPST